MINIVLIIKELNKFEVSRNGMAIGECIKIIIGVGIEVAHDDSVEMVTLASVIRAKNLLNKSRPLEFERWPDCHSCLW